MDRDSDDAVDQRPIPIGARGRAASAASCSAVAPKKVGMRLKLVIDKRRKKVMFAEADNKFVDFLFHILTLPVGTVARILDTNTKAGASAESIIRLFRSVENMSNYSFSPSSSDSLLKPLRQSCGSQIPLLYPELVESSSSTTKSYYGCSGGCPDNVSESPYVACSKCKKSMDRKVTMIPAKWYGYVKCAVAYMVMDDLEVKPLSTTSVMAELKAHGKSVVEERVVKFCSNEAVKLLNAMFVLKSKTVLTDVFIINSSSSGTKRKR